MEFKMKQNRILFKKVDIQAKTQGGIILGTHTAEADKRDTGYGQVICAGPDTTVQEGAIIAFNDRQPMGVMYKGESYFMIRESDVFFEVEDELMEVIPFQTTGNEFITPFTKQLK
jgi:co-chaperonin GroES (HSP10)